MLILIDRRCAELALEDIIEWFKNKGQVAVSGTLFHQFLVFLSFQMKHLNLYGNLSQN